MAENTANTGFTAYDYVANSHAAMQQQAPEGDPEVKGNEVTDPRPDFLKKKESAESQQKKQSKPNKKKAKENKPSQEPTRDNKASEASEEATAKAEDTSEAKADTSKAEKLAKKAKGESTASKSKSSGKQGSGRKRKFSENAVIRVKPEYKNPDAAKKPKTKAHKMYEILVQCDGMTVADYEKALDNQWPDRPASYSASHELDWCANKKEFITVEEPEAEAEAA